MKLKDNLWGIFGVAKANNADLRVAKDMFVSNLEQGKDAYPGAANVDWDQARDAWTGLTVEEQTTQKQEVSDLIGEHYKELTAAWNAQDKVAFDAVLAEGV